MEWFLQKWQHAQVDGHSILNYKTLREIEALRVHIIKGCLSGIPPKCGTNKNEALHRSIRPLFYRCRMGIPLALALMTATLHFYNRKQAQKHQAHQQATVMLKDLFYWEEHHKDDFFTKTKQWELIWNC